MFRERKNSIMTVSPYRISKITLTENKYIFVIQMGIFVDT